MLRMLVVIAIPIAEPMRQNWVIVPIATAVVEGVLESRV